MRLSSDSAYNGTRELESRIPAVAALGDAVAPRQDTEAVSHLYDSPASAIRPMHRSYNGYALLVYRSRQEGGEGVLLQHLETFVRVVEEGSFTRAGELLNLSQPAVTRQIAALERELGAPLLERGRGLHLTAVGQTAYTHARHVIAEVEHLKANVASLSDPQSGEVSIACVTTVGLFTLPQLLNEYRAAYPRVRLRVWSARADGVIDRLLDGNSEIGLTSTPVAHPRLETMPLFEDPIIPVAAPSLAAQLP